MIIVDAVQPSTSDFCCLDSCHDASKLWAETNHFFPQFLLPGDCFITMSGEEETKTVPHSNVCFCHLSWCPSKKSLQDHEPFPYTFFYQFTGSYLMFKSLVLSVSHLGPLWFIETLGLLFYFFFKCCLTFDRDCMGSVDCLLCVNILIIFTLWVIKQRVHRSYLISLVIKKTLGIQLPNIFRWALII